MPEEVKFTEEEMEKVKGFQSEYSNLQIEFGQTKITKLTLEDRLNATSISSPSVKLSIR